MTIRVPRLSAKLRAESYLNLNEILKRMRSEKLAVGAIYQDSSSHTTGATVFGEVHEIDENSVVISPFEFQQRKEILDLIDHPDQYVATCMVMYNVNTSKVERIIAVSVTKEGCNFNE